MFYWRCPKCGGPSEMAMLCEKCKKIEADALGTATTSKKYLTGIIPHRKGKCQVEITDYETQKVEKFGSRDFKDSRIDICTYCKNIVRKEYDDYCRDYAGQIFCCEDCFKKYYGFRESVL